MINTNKALSMLGLAARSRNIVSGEDLVIKGIQKGKVFYVIVTEDASTSTTKKIMDKCSFYQVPYKVKFTRDVLGHAIGKESRVVVGVMDKGFKVQLEKLLE